MLPEAAAIATAVLLPENLPARASAVSLLPLGHAKCADTERWYILSDADQPDNLPLDTYGTESPAAYGACCYRPRVSPADKDRYR